MQNKTGCEDKSLKGPREGCLSSLESYMVARVPFAMHPLFGALPFLYIHPIALLFPLSPPTHLLPTSLSPYPSTLLTCFPAQLRHRSLPTFISRLRHHHQARNCMCILSLSHLYTLLYLCLSCPSPSPFKFAHQDEYSNSA